MNIADLLKSKRAGAYAGLAVGCLAVVGLILYLSYALSSDGLMMPVVPVLLALIILAEMFLFFADNDIVPILAAGMASGVFGAFLYSPPETIGSIVDYYQNIVMFGNPEKFGLIVSLIVIFLLMTVLAVVACFMRRTVKG